MKLVTLPVWQLFQCGVFIELLQLRNRKRKKLSNKVPNAFLDYRAPPAQGQAGAPWTTCKRLNAGGGGC